MYPTQTQTHSPSDVVTHDADVLRVLQALSLQRVSGWHLPGYYLGITYETVSPDEATLTMNLDRNIGCDGQPLPVALCILADVALAAAIRGHVGFEARLATISAKLTFTARSGAHPLVARSQTRFESDANTIAIRNSAVTILSGDTEMCFAQANFAVLDRPADKPAQALPHHGSLEQGDLLDINELTGSEKLVYQRALKAGGEADHGQTTFTERFWGLTPTAQGDSATCEIHCGLHIGNRVGHVQGGILLGLAISTSLAVVGQGWRILEINANFIRPGTEGTLRASSRILHRGRNLAHVICEITTTTGRLVLQAQSTMVRQ